MKVILLIVVLVLCLTGCSAPKNLETVSDVLDTQVVATPKKLEVAVPEGATVCTVESGEGSLWLCDGYTLSVQTMAGGDLDRTLAQLTGFTQDQLTVMQTKQGDIKRREFVWSAAGEGGDQVGRAVILDDGSNHYTVCVMADAEKAGNLTQTWQKIFDSVALTDTD